MTIRPWLALVFSLAAAPTAAAAAAAPREIYAVVVGHNGGRPGLPVLRYADDDAVRFARFFGGLGAAGSTAARVWLLTRLDADTERQLARAEIAAPAHLAPTRGALRSAFAALARALATPARGERVLYFVYAGHGLHGRVLLEPEGAAEAAITGTELRAELAELGRVDPRLRVLLFIDACRSQSLFGERDGDAGPDFSSEVATLERRAESLRLGVLTAASTGKPAGEVQDLGAGYFSHALASGLAGAADANGDEVVSFGELAAFVAFNTRRLTGQLPWFDPPGGDLGAPALDLRGQLPRLVIPVEERGRFLVEARGGPPVFAEAYKEARRPLRLALPPGQYRVRRSADGRAQAAAAVLRAGQWIDAGRLAWSDDARTEARGPAPAPEIDLAFSAAFTPEAVSTLEAGFRAGRAPASALAARRLLVLGGTAGPAPLGLGGVELGIALGARQRLGRWAVGGVRLSFATSSHRVDGAPYRLERPGLLAEGGLRLAPAPWLDLQALVGGGAAAAIRRGEGPASGDPVAPLLSAGAGAHVALGGRWALVVEARYLVHWVRIDGARGAHGGALVDVGLGWGP
jgi:uncharacterized caspase-like protein